MCFFCTGTDEHGQKIENKAAAAGVTPQAFVDNTAGGIKALWDRMNVSLRPFYPHDRQLPCCYRAEAVQALL